MAGGTCLRLGMDTTTWRTKITFGAGLLSVRRYPANSRQLYYVYSAAVEVVRQAIISTRGAVSCTWKTQTIWLAS
eukprot:1569172-Amphidinium_carterae.3